MERLAGRVILLWGWPRRFAAFFAGAFATLALAPVDFFAACFLAFPVLVWLLDGTPGAGTLLQRFLPAFSVGWWFGFGWFLAGMWWVGVPFYRDPDHAWALPIAVFGLPALLALFYALAALLARLLWSDGVGRIAALAFAFGVVEWLRSVLLPGLGWNAVGYAAMPVPLLMQAAEFIGTTGMTALAVFVFSAPALLGTGLHARAGLAIAGLLVAIQVGYGYVRLATSPAAETFLQVRIVQPAAVGADFEETFATYLELTGSPVDEGETPPQLVLWPELSVPFVLAERPDLLDEMVRVTGDGRILVAGTLRDEGVAGKRRLYNAVVAVDGEAGIRDAADKLHLVPFADYLPMGEVLRAAGFGDGWRENTYVAGSARRLFSVSENVDALPLLGVEALGDGPDESAVGEAEIILNPANYAELSGTPAPHQHLRQAQLQAVETGLPLLLATPKGISAAIDSRGRILGAFADNTHGVLDVSVPITSAKATHSGNITLQGLTFSAIFGMFAVLLIIRVSICSRRN